MGIESLVHNLYEKTLIDRFSIAYDFNSTIHADFVGDDGSQNKDAIAGNTVDFDNKDLSDYAESLVSLILTINIT